MTTHEEIFNSKFKSTPIKTVPVKEILFDERIERYAKKHTQARSLHRRAKKSEDSVATTAPPHYENPYQRVKTLDRALKVQKRNERRRTYSQIVQRKQRDQNLTQALSIDQLCVMRRTKQLQEGYVTGMTLDMESKRASQISIPSVLARRQTFFSKAQTQSIDEWPIVNIPY